MSPSNDQAGRIHKQAFVISTAVLFAFCLTSAALRFYIRVRVQKQLSIDDGFLVLALCCTTTALGILYSVTVNKMYLVEALSTGLAGAYLPADTLQEAYDFHKWITVTLMLIWCAIMAVKFSFLFLFRKLVDRIRPLIIYWWVVTVFNVGVLGFGVTVYYLSCPYYSSLESLNCTSEAGTKRTMAYAISQTILDLVGDFLILFIPIRLIWKIQIKWNQKAILALSLCLTILMIIVTITRVSGIKLDGKVDQVWESYWLILSAEVGIILTAITAFRAFFVSRNNRNNNRVVQSPGGRIHWYYHNKPLLKRIFTPVVWRSKSRKQSSSEGFEACEDGHFPMEDLPNIPRAHMTGIRTFIDGRGKVMNASHIMQSRVVEEDDDTLPLHMQHQRNGNQV